MITQCTPKPISLYCDQCRKAKACGKATAVGGGGEWRGGGVVEVCGGGGEGAGNSIIVCAYLQREACSA